VVGDATGKGLEAATYTAEIKFVLRAFLRENSNPAVALERLNNFVVDADRLDPERFGTSYTAVALAIVNTLTGEARIASAGMEPPFVLRADTGAIMELSAGGPIMGVLPRAVYQAQDITLLADDLLVMCTDGITEARRGRKFFGYEGLVQSIQEAAAHGNTLSDIGMSVAEKARTFSGGKLRDDVCLLLARRRDVPFPAVQ
jgi:serine phosphatase RsbU (regulator of sigma subunit)